MAVNSKKLVTQQSVNAAVKQICDIMRRSNCAGALQYVPELTWILFLRILDEREEQEAAESAAVGVEFKASLAPPFRWRDWAAPGGPKRTALQEGAPWARCSSSSTRSCCHTCARSASSLMRRRARRSSARS
jgi:type I restriction enzyme M protein